MTHCIVSDGSAEFADILGWTRSFLSTREGGGTYVTVGVFDGVHRGHQQLVAKMVGAAHSSRNLAVVVIVAPHPMVALGGDPPPMLTTVDERVEKLSALGPDAIVILPFTPATARIEAVDFIEMLTRHLRLAALWGGPDLALGHRRDGDISSLRCLGMERGFAVRIVEPLSWKGDPVNSSRVRAALQSGDLDQATGCLGHPYRLAGSLVRSHPESYCCLPPPGRLIPAGGIYACIAHTEYCGSRPAMASIAARPVLTSRKISHDRQEQAIEAYLPDLDVDLRNQTLALDFVAHMREEKRCSSLPSLRQLAARV